MSKIFTTISSGKFKGKKLELPSLKTTRSTKSIVKGSFFDTLRNDLRGKVFIEGFGGSAVMACEALSNGALSAVAIEKDKAAFALTRKNMQSIDEINLKAVNADSFLVLPDIIASQKSPVLLYLDPPFDIRDGFDDIYDKLLTLIIRVQKDKIFMIVFEHISSFKFPENIGDFALLKTKKFGATTLSYFG
ncbi:16S rRNA (guanine(966)-N(2))-methyltransferase RsmD [Campylobacter sp. RM9344]|uniref:16S rRNA (Guanine(966)-N(2))-methyltransferase RsmD n=1 Tax=Campylobacter californiensis TaxID=1032243 RepID=A0AAW3ZX88_9BACT|nr:MULTISPECIES: 16S rRNA (guanine(966)-N(2))-methyltransferase RsmD [unclassified Campylobacter]MBE2983764.1 16S rRNA (guanine(966)-N(2))-methyltransferase RsmD [Campylobacter sp. RM6883]MBE2985672.1 16S rRNA (guanine(966)-N(2))-methyltransferase RsmD [Campylobacter sp. RM12919]MBE2987299.1 16S rRNA (guanine(966)-N(2))-methyltransferase RsmD [Campylobacter sp. RM12920]MBE2994303.1 16S rRNA (guanine(966)-N(2))-methyltransferase RsmD [Campylobacter sp. RM6913]MBE3028611.1 16S rRNA (guanine(966)